MAVDPSVIGPATLVVGQAVGMANSFLPKISEVRTHGMDDTDFVADLRMGEAAAGIMLLGIGAICSSLTSSSIPLLVTIVMLLLILGLYEMTLTANRPFERKVV